ncbi:MAG: hypothetical protein QOF30_1814 [Acidimicrobiaceae bacterium]|jgi:hypothetical protein|nr:hypothetical protein [Acidimicrobiaceae bacterium]
MEVGNAVASVLTHVEHQPVAPVRHALLFGHLAGRAQQLSQQRPVVGSDLARMGNVALRHDQHVHRRRGLDVPEGVGVVGRQHALGWDLAADDPAKQAVFLGTHPEFTVPLAAPDPIRSAVAGSDEIDALLASAGRSPDDDLAEASAQSRSRRRWLRQQVAESSTMAGVLMSLAEGDAAVTIRCGRWTHAGRLRRVTAALCVMEQTGGIALIPTASITSVEAPVAVADDRAPAGGLDLAAVLAAVVAEHPPLRLQLDDGTEVAGTLVDLGKDVAVVRLTSCVATVRLSAVASCILLGPGTGGPPG